MDILGSISFGAVSGLLGPIISGFLSYKTKKMEFEHEVAMFTAKSQANVAEVEAAMKIVGMQVQGAVDIAEADTFRQSVKTDGEKEYFKADYLTKLMDSGWFGKLIGGCLAWLMGIVDFLRGLARPLITYYLIGISTWITVIATSWL